MENKYDMRRYYALVKIVIIHLLRNAMVKFLGVCFIVLFASSVAMYYTEKNYIRKIQKDGKEELVHSNIDTLEDSIWWAVVTSTTVGYGDKFPISRLGRIIGILTMFTGMALVGVITGNIASTLVEKQLKEDKGLKTVKAKNHYCICGWKNDMAQILTSIAKKHEIFGNDIVLVCMAEPEAIENLKDTMTYSKLQYVYGDHIDENVLRRANVQMAKKVLVLADESGKSTQDVDARTIMSVMSIKSINRNVYVCAELIDEKYERYLRIAGCDEIILTHKYTKHIIADVFTSSGLANVISELIDVNAHVSLKTYDIPHAFINKTYDQLEKYFANQNKILIGVIENTGNFYDRKRMALQEAQKTSDISTLIDNLRTVKMMIPNYPVLNPRKDYIIKQFSKAVCIEGSTQSSGA